MKDKKKIRALAEWIVMQMVVMATRVENVEKMVEVKA